MTRTTHDGTRIFFDAIYETLREELLDKGCPASDVNDIVACEIQREDQIAAGRPYYDYETQEWRNVP